jgi:hypothetical protein
MSFFVTPFLPIRLKGFPSSSLIYTSRVTGRTSGLAGGTDVSVEGLEAFLAVPTGSHFFVFPGLGPI